MITKLKIASAIGKVKAEGVIVEPPDINESTFTFSPDVVNNTIRYGLSGITKVGEDLVKEIMEKRPYSSMEDFLQRVKASKPQMVNLIKSGAFDCFGDRCQLMEAYADLVSDKKKRVTLQNMKMLIDFNLLPETLLPQIRLFNFNKYLKKFKDNGRYMLDAIAFEYFQNNYNIDDLQSAVSESGFAIKQEYWDAVYKRSMEPARQYIKTNQEALLFSLNSRLYKEIWDKYCRGSLSQWEMDSVSFYSHEHELAALRPHEYGIEDYNDLPDEPIIERIIPIKGKQIPLFKISRIAGTVLDKDKSKKTVTLLTQSGVVTVKIFGPVFSNYDKQISEKGEDGKKHVCEKSWFARGTKIVVTGLKRDDMFIAKKYKKTPYHLVEKIIDLKEDGTLITQGVRYGEVEE